MFKNDKEAKEFLESFWNPIFKGYLFPIEVIEEFLEFYKREHPEEFDRIKREYKNGKSKEGY